MEFVIWLACGGRLLGIPWRICRLASRNSPPSYDWWGPSRVNTGNFDITEFPFFTFSWGSSSSPDGDTDLYVTYCFIYGLCFSCQEGRFTHSVVLAAMLGLSIAISKMTNTWDMPTLCLVAVIAFVFGSTILK